MAYDANYSVTGQRGLVYGDGSDGRTSNVGGGGVTLTTPKFYSDANVAGTGAFSMQPQQVHVYVLGSYKLVTTVKGQDAGSASGSSGAPQRTSNSLPGSNPGQSGTTTAASATAGASAQGVSGDQGGGGISAGGHQADGSHPALPAGWSAGLWGLGMDVTAAAVGVPMVGLVSSNTHGRGSGDGTNAGGGSASGAGTFLLGARYLVQVSGGSISSTGGNGGAGAAGMAGGGGATGTGGFLLVSDSYIGPTINTTRTEGAGGAGQGGAGNGGSGTAGSTSRVTNA